MELLQDKNRKYRRLRPNPSEKIQLANAGLQWVLSSNVSAVGKTDTDLIIRFHNGSLYSYPNQAKLFEPMMNSNSKGHYVWVKLRRPKVAFKRIGQIPFKDDEQVTDDELFELVEKEGLGVEQRLAALGVFIAPEQFDTLGLLRL